MLRRIRNLKRVGLLATVLAGGAMLTPASIFAADRGHSGGHDRGHVVVQHFDGGRHFDRDRVDRGFDRDARGFYRGIVVNPPVYGYGYYAAPDYGYYAAPAAPAPYAYPAAPDCNVPPYGY